MPYGNAPSTCFTTKFQLDAIYTGSANTQEEPKQTPLRLDVAAAVSREEPAAQATPVAPAPEPLAGPIETAVAQPAELDAMTPIAEVPPQQPLAADLTAVADMGEEAALAMAMDESQKDERLLRVARARE